MLQEVFGFTCEGLLFLNQNEYELGSWIFLRTYVRRTFDTFILSHDPRTRAHWCYTSKQT